MRELLNSFGHLDFGKNIMSSFTLSLTLFTFATYKQNTVYNWKNNIYNTYVTSMYVSC